MDRELEGGSFDMVRGGRLKAFLYCKRLFLTYPNAPINWTKEYVRDKLLNEVLINKYGDEKYRTKVSCWLIGEALHESGEKHYHCILEGYKKMRIYDEKELDIVVDGSLDENRNIKKHHGNYQSVRNIFYVIDYVRNQGTWIGDGFIGMKSKDIAVLRASTERKAKEILFNEFSARDKLEFRREIEEVEIRRKIVETIAGRAPDYPYQNVFKPYERKLKDIPGFSRRGRAMGVLLHGEPESGKSSFAYKIAAELKENVVVFTDLNDITPQNYSQQGIILLDEMKGYQFKEKAARISSFVTDEQARTERYHGSEVLIWPRKVIIATNEDPREWEWTLGLKSRFVLIEVFKNGSYQYRMWNKNLEKLIEMTDIEVKENLEYIDDIVTPAHID